MGYSDPVTCARACVWGGVGAPPSVSSSYFFKKSQLGGVVTGHLARNIRADVAPKLVPAAAHSTTATGITHINVPDKTRIKSHVSVALSWWIVLGRERGFKF